MEEDGAGPDKEAAGKGLIVDAAQAGNPSPKGVDCTKLEEILDAQFCWHKGREKLLVDRISELHDEVAELRGLVSSLMDSLDPAKKQKKKKKVRQESLAAGGNVQSVQSVQVAVDESGNEQSCTRTHGFEQSGSHPVAVGTGMPSRTPTKQRVSRIRSVSKEGRSRAASDQAEIASCTDSDTEWEVSGRHRTRAKRSHRKDGSTTREISLPSDDEDLFQLVSSEKSSRRTKRKDLFVGNLLPTTTDDRLTEYIHGRAKAADRAVTLHFVSVAGEDEEHELSRARISVNARDAPLLLHRNFWPRNVYARPWRFKENHPDMTNAQDTGKGKLPVEKATPLKDHLLANSNAPGQATTPLPSMHSETSTPNRKRQRDSPLEDDTMPSTKAIHSNLVRDERPAFARFTGPRLST